MSASDNYSPYQRTAQYMPPCGWPGDFGGRNIYYAAALRAAVPMTTGIFVGITDTPPAIALPGVPANFAFANAYSPEWSWCAPGNGSGTAPVGIILRPTARGFTNYRDYYTADVDVGVTLDILTQGDALVWLPEANYAATQRDWALFSNNTTGAITAAAAGGTVAGSTETQWRVFRKLSDKVGGVLASTFR